MGPEQGKAQQFYRYTDTEGRVHIVTSLGSLPPGARGKAELVVLDAEATRAEHTVPMSGAADAKPFELDGVSFGAGFAVAIVLAAILKMMPEGMRWLPKLAVVVAIAALGTGLYLGYLRKTTGTGSGPLASPSSIIQDAKDAVEKVNQKQREREAELRAIQAEGATPAAASSKR
ncbi:MAG TPA: hypothetical protein VJN18_15030 [Polyangiaceae bacterium]|nr:hypothetical protein [Polyangiaceae bacterium]